MKFVHSMKEKNLISSISIGVNEDSYKLIEDMRYAYLIPDYITIDIAHGHSIKMEKMVVRAEHVLEPEQLGIKRLTGPDL
jgi:GMP reductase